MIKFSKAYSVTLFAVIVLFLTQSCTQKPALVLDRSSYVYNKGNSYSKNKYSSKKYSSNRYSSGSRSGNVEVIPGDTVYSIATRNNIPLRDLINHNNLEPPYILRVGDKISLPNAQYYQVAQGDTLYGISREFNMNVNDLIALNNFEAPYYIKAGEKIRVRGSAASNPSNQSSSRYRLASDSRTKSSRPISRDLGEVKLPRKNNRFTWPVKGVVISKFGPKTGGLYNDGINIKAKSGDDVKAAEDGVVAYVGNELRGYGNLVIVKHSEGWISAYAHLSKSKVNRGDKVSKGQTIAFAGSTGNVKSAQLYFGLRKGREAVNPQVYL
jgi:murein DD-endopeptidase MepM/ murein hydrolase activator NlpD